MSRYISTREREVRNILAASGEELGVKVRTGLLRELKAIEIQQQSRKRERVNARKRGEVVDKRCKLPATAMPVVVPPTAPRPQLKPGEFSWFTFDRATREQIATALAANAAHDFIYPDETETWDEDAARFQAAGCPIPGDRYGAIRKNEVRNELEPGFDLVWGCGIGYEATRAAERASVANRGELYAANKKKQDDTRAAFIAHFESTYRA